MICSQSFSAAFKEKIKSGKATASSSGFGGKGLDRFERDRDAVERVQRSAYGETADEDKAKANVFDSDDEDDTADVADIVIQRGPAPEGRQGQIHTAPSDAPSNVAGQAAIKQAEADAAKNGCVQHCSTHRL